MRPPSETSLLIGAIKGWQGRVLLSKDTQASLSAASYEGVDLPMVGIWGPGTFYGFLPCQGCGQLDLKLRASAITNTGGEPVVTIWRTLVDFITEKLTSAGASQKATSGAFVAAAEQTLQQLSLLGEVGCLVRLVVPPASAITFDRAEYSAL